MPYQKWNQREEAALERGVQKHGEGNWLEILKAPLPSQRRPVRLRHALSLVVQDPEFAVLRERNLTNVQLKDKYRLRTRSATLKPPKTASSHLRSAASALTRLGESAESAARCSPLELRSSYGCLRSSADGFGSNSVLFPILVQACCGHRLEQSHRSVGWTCRGCYESRDSSASFRCTEGCNFDLCGSCHANGYPSAPFQSCRVLRFDGAYHRRVGPCSAAQCTALHNAARQGDAGGIKALLAEGSDVHCKDPGGYSLRSLSCLAGVF
jgi:hypothetical protein